MMRRRLSWLGGFVVLLLMSGVVCISLPAPGSLPSARPLTGPLSAALFTPPRAQVAPSLPHPPRIRVGPATATNWSGYVITGPAGSISAVTGSWVVPPVTCAAGETSYAAFWIGIDGDSSPTVEQIGTDSDCQDGVPTYYAWFEFFPFRPRPITTVPVAPGHVIGAEVTYHASTGKFELFIVNVTSGSTFAIARWFPGKRASAEWIAEVPASGAGVLPLANFGSVAYGADFTGVGPTNLATVNGQTGPIAAFGAAVQAITMVSQSNAVKAQPSGLSPDGTSFLITWASAGP